MKPALFGLVTSALSLVAPPLAADTLTQRSFATTFVDQPLGYYLDGVLHRIRYSENGSVVVTEQGRTVYTGQWWWEAGALCTHYDGWPKRCGQYTQNDATTFTTPRTGTVIFRLD